MLSMRTTSANQLEPFESPIPVPGAGEVVIRMLATGICAGDIQIFHGKHKYAVFPLVQGHEGVGVVHAVGPGVDSVKENDRVVIQQQLACGDCAQCKKGRHNFFLNMEGLIGVFADGLFNEYFRCPTWNAVPVPADFSTDQAMLVEPASVAVHSVQVENIAPGETVAIIGAGVIGNFVAQACRAAGATDVLIADIASAKLAVSKRNGIAHCVNSRDNDLADAIKKAFGGELATVVFDCAGVPASIKQALSVTANCGRTVIVVNFKEPVEFDIPSFQRREVTIMSVMGTVKKSTEKAAALLHAGTITIDGLISAHFPLSRMADAYSFIDNNAAEVMKVAINIGV